MLLGHTKCSNCSVLLSFYYITVIVLFHCNFWFPLHLLYLVSIGAWIIFLPLPLLLCDRLSFFLSQFPASRPRMYGPSRWHQTRRWSRGPSPREWPWTGFWRATVWCSGPSTPMEVGAVGARHLGSIRVIIRYYCYSLTRRSPCRAPPTARPCICIPASPTHRQCTFVGGQVYVCVLLSFVSKVSIMWIKKSAKAYSVLHDPTNYSNLLILHSRNIFSV